jgi:hypothetical protein
VPLDVGSLLNDLSKIIWILRLRLYFWYLILGYVLHEADAFCRPAYVLPCWVGDVDKTAIVASSLREVGGFDGGRNILVCRPWEFFCWKLVFFEPRL